MSTFILLFVISLLAGLILAGAIVIMRAPPVHEFMTTPRRRRKTVLRPGMVDRRKRNEDAVDTQPAQLAA